MAWMPRPIPVQKKKTSIAVPVMSQGMAIGGSRRSRSRDCPRNCPRLSANAASVPSAVAIADVAQAITRLLRVAASKGPLSMRMANQCSDVTVGRLMWDQLAQPPESLFAEVVRATFESVAKWG